MAQDLLDLIRLVGTSELGFKHRAEAQTCDSSWVCSALRKNLKPLHRSLCDHDTVWDWVRDVVPVWRRCWPVPSWWSPRSGLSPYRCGWSPPAATATLCCSCRERDQVGIIQTATNRLIALVCQRKSQGVNLTPCSLEVSPRSLTHLTSTSGLLCRSTTWEEKFSKHRAAWRVARTAFRYGRKVAV